MAAEIGARSVAIPAISTGIYGYPPESAATIAVTTLMGVQVPEVEEVVLVAFDDETRRRYEQILGTGG